MKKQTMGKMLFLATISSLMIGCGDESFSGDAENGWTGKFVDSAVQGAGWECGSKSGKTSTEGIFGECPSGTKVTLRIGNVKIGEVGETSDKIVTPQDLVGAKRNTSENSEDVNAAVNALAALLLTLDSDGDPSNGIGIAAATADAAAAAITANGGAITATNVGSITAATVEAVPTLRAVSVTAAATHLVETVAAIANGTIKPPVQASGGQGGN